MVKVSARALNFYWAIRRVRVGPFIYGYVASYISLGSSFDEMGKQGLKNLAVWCVTLGALMITICGVKDQFVTILRLPPVVLTLILIVGVLLILVATAIGIILFLPLIIQHRSLRTFEPVMAERGDLETLHEFCEKYMGSHFATLESWRKRHEKNPGTFFMVKEFRKGRFKSQEKLVGAFTIIPVTELARELLERGDLSAVTFSPQHVASPLEPAAALYISGLVGSNFKSRGFVLSYLVSRLRTEQGLGNHLLYTRPMTTDGLRLAKRYGFYPVNPTVTDQANRIYKKDSPSGIPPSVLPSAKTGSAKANRLRFLQKSFRAAPR